MNILCAAGSTTEYSQLEGECRKALEDEIIRLWRLAGRFASTAKESVLSTDYEIIFFVPGSKFDQGTAHGQGAEIPRGREVFDKDIRVSCTTELGLKRTTNVSKPGGTLNDILDTVVVSKATILFEHEISEYVRPL